MTIDTLPSFDNCKLIDVSGECTLTVIWLRNPNNTEIVFGSNFFISKKNNRQPIDSLLTSVQYQLEGEELIKRLSHNIQYQCRSIDGCNNGTNLKRIFHALRLEEDFVQDQFDSLILSDPLFNNQSINNCYLARNSTKHCSSIDHSHCRRCQMTMDYSPLSTIEICATCPTITSSYNSIKRDAIFIINNRSQIIDRIQLLCQRGEHCNSIENSQQIRQASFIHFDFDKYFSSSSSSSSVSCRFLSSLFPMIFFLIKFIF